MRELIIDRVLDMNILPATRELAAKSDMEALSYECGKVLAEATIDMVQENTLVKESLMEGLGKLGTFTEGVEALYNGDYKTAVVEFTDLGVTLFGGAAGGAVTALKSIGDLSKAAVEQGIIVSGQNNLQQKCCFKTI